MADINFGILDTQLPGRIAAIPQEAQKQQTANMLQAMQMQKAMREGQMSQMKIDEMLAERKEIDTFAANLKARGYTQGSKGFFTELASSRNPTRMQQGFEGLRRLEEQEKFAVIMGRTRPAAAPVAAAPSVAPEPGSFGADMAARREADPFASRTNMLPGAAAGVNTLAGNAAEIEFKRQQRNDLIGMGTTQSIAAAKALDADIALASREPTYQNVPGVGLVNPRDKSVVMSSVETAPNSIRELQAFKKMTPEEQTTFMNMKRAGASSQVTNVKLPVIEGEYGKTFAKNTAEEDIKLLGSARNAPKVVTTANRVMELLAKPDIFVGPAAKVKLNVARALNVLGADETESMRNTEKLIAASGQGTLDAIKDANLGTGQGFTQKDLDFLRTVAGGTVEFTAENLRTMSRLQHRAAELSVKKWLARRGNMPESAIKGTGIDKETYELPTRIGGPTPEAIAYLKANPNTKAAFDKKFGDGEAEHTLRMGK